MDHRLQIFLAASILAIVGCSGPVAKPGTAAPVLAPTVAVPHAAAPVDLGPVSEGLGDVQARNVRLKSDLEHGKRWGALLEERLEVAEAAGFAGAEDLVELRILVDFLEDAMAGAEAKAMEQSGKLSDLMVRMSASVGRLAAIQQERLSLQIALDIANKKIKTVSENSVTIVGEREAAMAKAATAEGALGEVEAARSFWRWWAIGLALVIVVSVVWKISGFLRGGGIGRFRSRFF